MKAKKFILVVMAVFLIQILRGPTLIFLTPSVFIPERLWNLSFLFRHIYRQNVFPRKPPFQNSLIKGVKGIMRTTGEKHFLLHLRVKIT